MDSYIKAYDIKKVYDNNGLKATALENISFEIKKRIIYNYSRS